MDTITIPTKEYRELKQARERLAILFNKQKQKSRIQEGYTHIDELVGILSDVKELKGKSGRYPFLKTPILRADPTFDVFRQTLPEAF